MATFERLRDDKLAEDTPAPLLLRAVFAICALALLPLTMFCLLLGWLAQFCPERKS